MCVDVEACRVEATASEYTGNVDGRLCGRDSAATLAMAGSMSCRVYTHTVTERSSDVTQRLCDRESLPRRRGLALERRFVTAETDRFRPRRFPAL